MTISRATDYAIHKGWFNTTLTAFQAEDGIAILRLDADWYDSTIECLEHLFPQVNGGGLILIDDYYTWEGCSKAVHDYLSRHKSRCRISCYKGISIYQKGYMKAHPRLLPIQRGKSLERVPGRWEGGANDRTYVQRSLWKPRAAEDALRIALRSESCRQRVCAYLA